MSYVTRLFGRTLSAVLFLLLIYVEFSESIHFRCCKAILHVFQYPSFPVGEIHCACPTPKLSTPWPRGQQCHGAEAEIPWPHTTSFHVSPVLSLWSWGHRLFPPLKAKLIFLWRKHLLLWQPHRSHLACWRTSYAFVTWFRYWKSSWHFHVPFSGHEEREKAEVCLHLRSSLKLIGLKKYSPCLKKKFF